jgi:hypothetical protein
MKAHQPKYNINVHKKEIYRELHRGTLDEIAKMLWYW